MQCVPAWWLACEAGETLRHHGTRLFGQLSTKGGPLRRDGLHLASSVLSSKADQTSSQMPAESYVAATLWCFALVPMRLVPLWRLLSTLFAQLWRNPDYLNGVVQLVESAAHSAGHALFSDRRLALAVARGSGAAVAQLGAVASQSGIPVSLHGTGGAWVVAGEHANADTLQTVVQHSLDRKVCNTLNVCAIPASRAAQLVPSFLAGLDAAGESRHASPRLHVVDGSASFLPAELFSRSVEVERASGTVTECYATVLPESDLAIEWEWENSPEVTLVVVEDVGQAVMLCNSYSPHFTASLVSSDQHEHEKFYATIEAPFIGNGFTRWVDGQYALNAPELGLSNWQGGRMLGRGAILSGDSVHTVRYRATVTDHQTHR